MDSNSRVINLINDAIVASGRKFTELKKESFYGFFEKEGIVRSNWESLYDELYSIHNGKIKKSPLSSNNFEGKQKSFNGNDIDYYATTHNDVKKREPRKSIFSDITKIAG